MNRTEQRGETRNTGLNQAKLTRFMGKRSHAAARLLGLLIAASGLVFGAKTTICETQVVDPLGNLATGTIDVQPTVPFTTPAGVRVEQIDGPVQVRNGKFCVSLEPNDTAKPENTRYTAKWRLVNGKERTELWNVPTNSAVLAVKDVKSGYVAPTAAVALSQLQPRISWTVDVNALSYGGGTAVLTEGSDAITGLNTAWTSDMSGRWFFVITCRKVYRFTWVSATEGALDRAWSCPTTDALGTRYSLTQSTYVLASEHGLATTDIAVQCYGQAQNNQFSTAALTQRIWPANVLVYATGDVEILWRVANAGRCLLTR